MGASRPTVVAAGGGGGRGGLLQVLLQVLLLLVVLVVGIHRPGRHRLRLHPQEVGVAQWSETGWRGRTARDTQLGDAKRRNMRKRAIKMTSDINIISRCTTHTWEIPAAAICPPPPPSTSVVADEATAAAAAAAAAPPPPPPLVHCCCRVFRLRSPVREKSWPWNG